ncbi:MAG TPA: arginine deiminase family protein, partial [Phycisphaerae bacterium]|nr:arginine deiminase family protein [Phycisphaerae bacterium]
TQGELAELTCRTAALTGDPHAFVLPPVPNAYFSRDPAVVVRDSVISCKMHYVQRTRETKLVRAVIEHHPEFAGHAVTYGGSEFPTEDRPFTIEGGDVIILNEEAVLVGASERTRSATIEVLAQKVLDVGKVRRVYEIPIPTERLFMHLDTVFTVVDRGTVVWFPGVMEQLGHIQHYESGPAGGVIRRPDERDLRRILSDEFGREVEVIQTGGGDAHYASREQRTDGTNVFAIAPRKVISYDRNERTIAALEKAGVECVRVQGSELVRGLGGPRCMTMPLRRA